MRYRFRTEYLGSEFYGWQVQNQKGQKKFETVQSSLEEAFSIVLKQPIHIVGSGRTDTGVHARGQCAHFDFDDEIDVCKTIRSVNGLTKRKIRIRDLEKCSENFNARFDALYRYYCYRIYTRPVALMRDYGWECGRENLNLELMGKEAESFLGEHDFISFCIPRNDGKSTFCHIYEFRLEKESDWSIVFHIKGNRFLHRQVRAMVGTLFDIGKNRYPEGTIKNIFANNFKGERTWAPPQGLTLEDVKYKDY